MKNKKFSKRNEQYKKDIQKRHTRNKHFKIKYGGYYTENILKQRFTNFTNIKFTKLDNENTTKIMNKLNQNIPECCSIQGTTYFTLLERLSENWTHPIFIVGGAVRDYMKTKNIDSMNDIDINYTIDPTKIESLLTDLSITSFFKDSRNYIRVGPKTRNDYLEGFNINPLEETPEKLECKMNSLLFMIDLYNNEPIIYLVDLFGGTALMQAMNNIWEAPTPDYEEWLIANPKLLWRLLKFELRGYTVPIETKKHVYQYFINDVNITDYKWNNIWWTIDPNYIYNVFQLIVEDCKEIDLDPLLLIEKLISKKLIIANKI